AYDRPCDPERPGFVERASPLRFAQDDVLVWVSHRQAREVPAGRVVSDRDTMVHRLTQRYRGDLRSPEDDDLARVSDPRRTEHPLLRAHDEEPLLSTDARSRVAHVERPACVGWRYESTLTAAGARL